METWVLLLAGASFLIWVLVGRARRLFGRQQYRVVRLAIRLSLITIITTMLFLVLSVAQGFAPIMGLTAGGAIGLLGLALTRFESIDSKLYYTPNMYVGICVFSLLIVRLIYRMIRIDTLSGLANTSPEIQLAGTRSSPLTVGILFVLLGFYFSYHVAVLMHGWKLSKESSTDN